MASRIVCQNPCGVSACDCVSVIGREISPQPALLAKTAETFKNVAATNALTFTPAALRVSAGDIVRFTFGSVAHNVFFVAQAGAPADIAGNNANVAIEREFAAPGTYAYTCHIHPQMHGTVEVR